MSKRVRKVVCFGGGNLVPKVLLEPLKKYPVQITSITSMTESGGSTGYLRKELNVLPAGDISRHLVGLSSASKWKKDLFYSRFGKEKFPGGHAGHRFGTVFISLAEYVLGDFEKALKVTHDFLEVKKHKALPATLQKVQLMAELENGKTIEGEDEIDVPKRHNPKLKIKKVFLKPKAKVYPKVKKAIVEADLITLGPGDLYSSTIPCLLPEGMKEAFRKTKAKKVLICNALAKLGETNNFSVLDFVREVEKYMGFSLDFVLYNIKTIDKRLMEEYKRDNPSIVIVGQVKVNKNLRKPKFVGKDLLRKKGKDFGGADLIKEIFNLCKL